MRRILFVTTDSAVEPLGLMYLAAVAKEECWEPRVYLLDDELERLHEAINGFNPDIVGFSIYTGSHRRMFECSDEVRRRNSKIRTAIGGPHATCFPDDCLRHADYVVRGEGLHALREILRGEASVGILGCGVRESLPLPDRQLFYEQYPKYGDSPIKSVVGNLGCPYACTYCYNSMDKGLFPHHQRYVRDVIYEIDDISRVSPQTKLVYFQDDVFGFDLKWLRLFRLAYKARPFSFHAQTRFELLSDCGDKGKRRLGLLYEAGCTGLTMAIESVSPIVRREVLNRKVKQDTIFKAVSMVSNAGMTLRTEQMLGLPCGATTKETRINLEADLGLLAMNVDLRRQTGLPTMAWASIFVPYKGTKIWDYCAKHGFYSGDNDDAPGSFFGRSVLRYPKWWLGPGLNGDSKEWMGMGDQEEYRDRMQRLRDTFHLFALIPNGQKVAADYLYNDMDVDEMIDGLKYHLYDSELYGVNQ